MDVEDEIPRAQPAKKIPLELMRWSTKKMLLKLSNKESIREFTRPEKKIPRKLMQWNKEFSQELTQSKKKKEIRPELEVLKDMNVDELRNYLFPSYPMRISWIEQLLFNKLDDKVEKHGEEFDRAIDLSRKLADVYSDDCIKGSQFEWDLKLGDRVPIESLLSPSPNVNLVSRDGRTVTAEELSGKFVMICCFLLPDHFATVVWKAAVASYEMYSKLKGDFEMVIVAKMRDGWTHDEVAFNKFLEAFPSYCLAVPFCAKSSRNYICKSLGGMRVKRTLLIDPNQTILLFSHLGGPYDTELVPLYGPNSIPFPFVCRKFSDEVDTDALKNFKIPSSLEDFLCCKTSDFVSRKISLGSGAFRVENLPISELKSKLVGLYLYSTGHLLPLLSKIVEACSQNENGKELEIVVVSVPEMLSSDPHLFLELFSNVLAKRNISWWVAPYNNTASIVLKHMFENGERVVILGPNGQFVETRGAELMQIYGSYAYPFTLDCVVQKTLEELCKVTLESFFKLLEIQDYPYPCPCTGKTETKKNILFYFDYPFCINPEVYAAVKGFAKYDDVQIITVSFSEEIIKVEDTDNSLKDKVMCHTKGAGKSDKFFLRFFNGQFPTIVAFGGDGRICSLYAHLLPSSDKDKAQVKGNLREEILFKLDGFLDSYDSHGCRFLRDQQHLHKVQEYRQSRFC